MENNTGRALNWDDEITKESSEYVLLPEGTYNFVVSSLEKKWHNGSDKLPPCNLAEVKITCKGEQGENTVTKRFYLHSSCEGIISSFFLSIGLKKHGEPTKMRWNEIVGKTGRCKLSVRSYIGNDGTQKQTNDVKSFLEPATQTYAAGRF